MTDLAEPTTIRPAASDDIDAVAALWCEAFPGKRTAAERARMLETGGRYGGLETVLVARHDHGLVGACKIYRLTQHVAGVAMPMMGLAAVAVAAVARRQGLGARICGRAIAAARDRGDVISTLYPFRPDYYERLGWGLVGELHEYRFATAALPMYDETRYVRLARDPADADALAACYGRVAARSNGPIERDARIWAYRLAGEELGVRPIAMGSDQVVVANSEASEASETAGSPGSAVGGGTGRGRVVVYDRDGVGGYMLLRRVAGAGRDGELHIRELVAETEHAYRGLLGYVARLADRLPIARHTARGEERFGDRLSDPRPPGGRRARSLYFPTARLIRGPMLRVLDVPRALALRRYFNERAAGVRLPTTIGVEVSDRQVPENHGPWLVRIEPNKAIVTPAGVEPGDARISADARISTDASTFARIFAGELAPSDAARLGAARCEGDVGVLDGAFATEERFWLLDEF